MIGYVFDEIQIPILRKETNSQIRVTLKDCFNFPKPMDGSVRRGKEPKKITEEVTPKLDKCMKIKPNCH